MARLEDGMMIGNAILEMVVARGGQTDAILSEVYTKGLLDLDVAMVVRACQELGRQKREAFDTVVPDLGTIRELTWKLAAPSALVLAAPKGQEETYRCPLCRDVSRLWWTCEGDGVRESGVLFCGRTRPHCVPHVYVAWCRCWFAMNREALKHLEAVKLQKGKFVPYGCKELAMFDRGDYPWSVPDDVVP